MEIVIISHPGQLKDEATWINGLFEAGLGRFHLRKPGWSAKAHRALLDQIEPEHLGKIIIHRSFELCKEYQLEGIHLGTSYKRDGLLGSMARKLISLRFSNYLICSTYAYLSDLANVPEWMDTIFLSPVFGAISEKSHSAGFDYRRLKASLSQKRSYKIYALGGVDGETISQAEALKFDGAAMIGAIWSKKNGETPLEAYYRISASLDKKLATA